MKTNLSKRAKKEKVVNAIISVVMAIVCLILLIPFLWMVVSSFQPDADSLFSDPPHLPSPWRFENYLDVFTTWDFGKMLGNTLIVVFGSMALSIFASILVAYGFARFRARGKKVMFSVMLGTMMLPWIVTLMPSYILFQQLGWTGTFLPLIVPAIGGGAFNIFLLRQYFMGIPKSIDEAGILDGCSRFGVLWRLIIPQCKPILATLVVFSFNGAWSDYVGPSIYLMGAEDKYTLSVGLTILKNQALGQGAIPWHLIMAGCVLFALPMVVVLFAAQDAFVRGIVTTGLKD
ncbi:MAG: carbohydrate ABC transporter permease [Candidatus Fimimonas sp.]